MRRVVAILAGLAALVVPAAADTFEGR